MPDSISPEEKKIRDSLNSPMIAPAEGEGITPKIVWKWIKEDRKALETKVFIYKGEPIKVKVSDNPIRADARKHASKLLDMEPSERHKVEVGLIIEIISFKKDE